MALEIVGRLIQKLQVQSGTSARGNWSKQEFVIETLDQYPRKVCLSVFGEDKVRELSSFAEGETLRISINIESREYNNRWYTDVRAWRIVKDNGSDGNNAVPSAPVTHMPTSASTPAAPIAPVLDGDNEADDLPF